MPTGTIVTHADMASGTAIVAQEHVEEHVLGTSPQEHSMLRVILAKLEALVPVGYQDDCGFHYGVERP